MILTQDMIDIIAPEHGRTSCDDSNLANACGGWSGHYNPGNGTKEVIYPRCTRCYLMDHVGEDHLSLDFQIEISLIWAGD